jgi:hypothetical protein
MLWKTIGRWVLVVVAVPLAALGLRKLGQSIESKRGQTRGARILRKSAEGLDWLSGRSRDQRHPVGGRR